MMMYFKSMVQKIRFDDDYKHDDCDSDYDCYVDDNVYVFDKEDAITEPRKIIKG